MSTSTIQTLFANIRKAAFDQQTVKIGGGVFSPAELKEAAAQFDQIGDALAAGWQAFDGEEDSVKEEHAEVIEQMSAAADLVVK